MYLLFFLWLFVLCVSRPRKHYLIQGHKDLLLMFSSQSFIVLTLLFRSVIHSELNLCMVWGRSPMSFFCVRISIVDVWITSPGVASLLPLLNVSEWPHRGTKVHVGPVVYTNLLQRSRPCFNCVREHKIRSKTLKCLSFSFHKGKVMRLI